MNLYVKRALKVPQKVQLSLSIPLTKWVNAEEKQVTVYANTEMQIAYTDGLSEEQLFKSMQHNVNAVSLYATSGSAWIIEKVEKHEIRFAKLNTIRGSTYIALPNELSALKCLLNIQNINDSISFLYCYTAAYHFRGNAPHATWGPLQQKKTNPLTYARSNPLTHKAVGGFPMPMPIDKISAFERCYEVKVNIFRYEKESLYSFRVLMRDSDFVVNLF